MVKILVTGTMPSPKMDEAKKVYFSEKKPKYPDFVKKTDNWVTIPDKENYKAYAIYECPTEKLYAAIKALMKRYTFYASVEGYKFTIEPLIPEAEAMELFMQ